jgi:cellulose biosynthesis protein BcsQ
VLATYNIKGGVGKTSAAVNLAYLAAREGARCLLWDLDPQAACTYLLRVKPKVKGGGRKLVRLKSEVDGLIKGTDYEGLDLLPADFSYRHMDLVLDRCKRPTRRLARVLEPLRGEYEYMFLDCPPSISLVSESVFEAADALIVPVIPATLSARTFAQLDGALDGGRPCRPLILAFFSMVDSRKRLHREVISRMRGQWGDVLEPEIPASAEIERMGLRRDAVAAFAPGGQAACAYEALWRDIKSRLGSTPRRGAIAA